MAKKKRELKILEDERILINRDGRIWRVREFERGASGNYVLRSCSPYRAESKDKDGYLFVALSYDGVVFCAKAHRLVYLKHKGEIPDGYDVHHVDTDVTNNHINNLRLVLSSLNRKRVGLFSILYE